jgi:glutamyl-tRNA synthetase
LDDKTDVISREDLVKHFSLERISRTAAVFDIKKLQWMNGFYIRKLSTAELAQRTVPYFVKQLPIPVRRPLDLEFVSQVVALQQERAKTLCDFPANGGFFFVEDVDYPVDLLLKGGMSRERVKELLAVTVGRLEAMDIFDVANLEASLRSLSDGLSVKPGDLFGLLRIAVTGRTAAPPLFQTMAVVGKDKCLRRIRSAIDRLSAMATA